MQNSNKYRLLIVIGVFSVVSILGLYLHADLDISYSQNFLRSFPVNKIVQKKIIHLKSEGFYLAGATAERIYLGNQKANLRLFYIDRSLATIGNVKLDLRDVDSLKFRKPNLQIDSPFFYIKDGNMPGIFRGNLADGTGYQILKKTPPFIQAIPLTDNSFIIQSIVGDKDANQLKTVLCKTTEDSLIFQKDSGIENSNDSYYGGFGVMRYSKHLNKIIYTHFYSNELVAMDSGLHVLSKGQTIDSVSKAKVKLASVSKNTFTLASPPSVVNLNTSVSGRLLLVHSNLMAANESTNVFNKNSVIDVYDINSLKYNFSFYIPDQHDFKMQSFQIWNTNLITIAGPYLTIYDLNNILDNKKNLLISK